MSASTKDGVLSTVWNLPNQLTIARLLLSVVLFVMVALEWYLAGAIMFLVAASTDWLDGYFARKYGQVTVLGRILDPFADKVIICGTFIFLAAVPNSGLRAWMVVVIVGRELLVTALRSFLEQQGADFSASMSGKLKMVLQCAAATMSLFYLYYTNRPPEAEQAALIAFYWLLTATVWAALIATVWSGAAYVVAALNLLDRK